MESFWVLNTPTVGQTSVYEWANGGHRFSFDLYVPLGSTTSDIKLYVNDTVYENLGTIAGNHSFYVAIDDSHYLIVSTSYDWYVTGTNSVDGTVTSSTRTFTTIAAPETPFNFNMNDYDEYSYLDFIDWSFDYTAGTILLARFQSWEFYIGVDSLILTETGYPGGSFSVQVPTSDVVEDYSGPEGEYILTWKETIQWRVISYGCFGSSTAGSIIHIVINGPPLKPINPAPSNTATGIKLSYSIVSWEAGT